MSDAIELSNGADLLSVLNKLADLMERDLEKLAALESLDSGKGIKIAR